MAFGLSILIRNRFPPLSTYHHRGIHFLMWCVRKYRFFDGGKPFPTMFLQDPSFLLQNFFTILPLSSAHKFLLRTFVEAYKFTLPPTT